LITIEKGLTPGAKNEQDVFGEAADMKILKVIGRK